MRNPRFLALTTLEKVEAGAFIQEAFDPKGLKDVDRNLAETIVYGTVQNKLFLDHVIDRFVKKPENLDQNIRQLLRMALYQMHFLDRVPDHAVVSETVKMAKVISNVGAAGLVNGVLRRVIRQKEDAFLIRGEDEVTRLSIAYSFPKEWVVYFQQLLKDVWLLLNLKCYLLLKRINLNLLLKYQYHGLLLDLHDKDDQLVQYPLNYFLP